MTTHVLRVADTDGVIDSNSTSYANARAGTGTKSVNTTAVTDYVGQEYDTVNSNYYVRQYHGEVDCSGLPSGETIDLAEFYWRCASNNSVQDFEMQIREYDWGASLTTADFVAGADRSGDTLWATLDTTIIKSATAALPFTSTAALKTAVGLRGDLRFYMTTDRIVANTAPNTDGSDEMLSVRTGDNTGTANDPVLGVETSDASYSGPTLDETQTGVITTGTTASVNRPGTAAECEDSLILLFIVVDGNRTITMPSGFTAIHENIHNSGTAEMTQTACYKIGGASEPASYSFTIDITTRACVTASRISGHDATTPIEASGSDSISSGVMFSAPFDITTAQGNCLHMAFLGSDDGQDVGYIPGMTEVASFYSNYVSWGVHGVLCSTEVTDSGALSLVTANTRTEQRVLSSVAIAPGSTVLQHTATKGSMSFSGQSNVLDRYHGQSVGDGAITLSGQSNVLDRYHGQSVGDGAITLSGLATTIAKLAQLPVAVGSTVFTGQSASTSRVKHREPSPGSMTLSGEDISLSKYHARLIGTVSISVLGTAVELARKKTKAVLSGAFGFTGQAVTLETRGGNLVTYNVGPGHLTVNGRPTRYEPPPFVTDLHFPLTKPLTEVIERE